MFGGADDRLDAFGIRQARVFEQAEAEFQGQDAGYRIVNQGFVEQTGFYGFDGSLIELWGGHDQVVAGLDRIGCGVHVIGLDMLFPYRAADVVPVGDQRAIVLPCAAQLVGQQPFVERDRHAFDGLVAEHERAAAFLGHAFERRQEPGFELAVGEVGFGGVTAALGLGVTGEMLGAGQDRVLRQGLAGLGAALVALDHGGGEFADQHRVLAKGLVHAAPTGVAGDAQHRRKRPMYAGTRDLLGGGAAGGLDLVRIPADSHAELGRENSGARPEGVSMDAVISDNQRDAQTRLLIDGLGGTR